MNERFFSEDFLRRLERLALLARRSMPGQTQGERRSPKRGQSVEFSDFRPYVAGDDFRRIDWNAYARLERFFIKLFVEEEDLGVHFLIDTSRSMAFGQPQKLWYATRAAGALGYVALAGLDRVSVRAVGRGARNTNGDVFPPHRGKQQALALFQFLQALEQAPHPAQTGSAPGPAQQLRAFAGAVNQPGLLVLFSDLMDDGWVEGLRAMASRGFEITVVHILAPEEIHPELSGDLKLIDSEDASEVEITADYDLLERYHAGLTGWQEDLHHFCAARGMHYVPVATTLPIEELLFAWMRKQGVLR